MTGAFRGRREAGRLLGEALRDFKGSGTVILGILRGGVVVAREAANILGADLDIVLSRKLRAPHNPELAIGAIAEDGRIFLDSAIASGSGASEDYISKEAAHQKAEIERRAGIFRKILPKHRLKDKTVIMVDDGLATGATMLASLQAARSERPSKLVAALPVGSREAVDRIEGACDEVICLRMPDSFGAVGQFYDNFDQTDDPEVIAILKEEAKKK